MHLCCGRLVGRRIPLILLRYQQCSLRRISIPAVSPLTTEISTKANVLHPPGRHEQNWLDTVRPYGITSWSQLLAESSIGHTERLSSKISDDPKLRNNLGFWSTLLEFNQQQYGLVGVRTIWFGMRYRGPPVKLDPRHPSALRILRTLINTAAEDASFLRQICAFLIQQRYTWHGFFAEVLSLLIERQPRHVVAFSNYLKQHCRPRRQEVMDLFHKSCELGQPEALDTFRNFYTTMPKTKIYDEAIGHLWKLNRPADATIMHTFLLSQGDYPTSFRAIQPFVRYIARTNGDIKHFTHSLDVAGISYEAQLLRVFETEKVQAASSGSSSEQMATKTSTRLSDAIVASAFATTAFSFDFILNGLLLLGLQDVGPLAVRQMAITFPDAKTLRARFERLRELNIDTGSSKFVRILKRVCAEGDSARMALIANCDLHHDCFDDDYLQRRLLTQYYRDKDSKQMVRTLTILNDGLNGLEAKQYASNVMLRTALWCQDWNGALTILNCMRSFRYQILRSTIQPELLDRILDEDITTNPHPETIDRVGYLIGMFQQILAAGSHIELMVWSKPLKALGRQNRFDELEALVIWIAEWYKPNGLHHSYLSRPLFGQDCDLSRLFTSRFQGALISWSLYAMPMNIAHEGGEEQQVDPPALQPWLRGASLVKTLKEKYGIGFTRAGLHRVFTHRLKEVYSNYRLWETLWATRLRKRALLHECLTSWAAFWDLPNSRAWVRYNYVAIQYQAASRKLTRRRPSRTRTRALTQSASGPHTQPKSLEEEEDILKDVVVYRDLFNASWIDYKR